ncbi:MAG: hypothetical protein ACOH2H_21075 [Cypionkella sp.]
MASQSEPDRLKVSRVYANIGKSIEAFERRVEPPATRFGAYTASPASGEAMDILTTDELAGLRRFVGKVGCVNCHNGPLLSDNHFHNTGVGAAAGRPEDVGRTAGAPHVRQYPFNYLGAFSDAAPEACTAP